MSENKSDSERIAEREFDAMQDAFEMWYAESCKGHYDDYLKDCLKGAYSAGHFEGFNRGTSVFHQTLMPQVIRGVEAGIREGFKKHNEEQ